MEIHVVRRGDTVSAIARRYGVSASRILSDNGLPARQPLVVGQALLILFPEEIYTVRQGDSLFSIARRFGTTADALRRNNPELILNPTLFPGQQITISFSDAKRRTITVGGYAYPNINRATLSLTVPFLSRLTPFGYGFTENGNLISINDARLIEAALSENAAPYMLLSSITEDGNFSGERASALFRSESLQNRVLASIVETMQRKGYQGLDIDFEYIPPEDSDGFLRFLENATEKLHAAGYPTHCDLAPKTYADQPGLLYEAHRYGEIGNIVDTVLLMTYEWGYSYGPPLAVAPLSEVRRVVQYAVTEIPRNKILMGIPNYGYDWTLPYEKGNRARNIGNEEAVRIAAERGAEILFDEKSASPYFYYRDNTGRRHVVWFEDVRSISAKYDLLDEFGLLGTAYWTIMRPFRQNWAFVNALYNIRKGRPTIG
ncbi:MAG: LysM peptidoglycan-binding domain-containing protein [Clostridia bacterium]|nr:LysM peptidoglycan-binding domain-containing protein [Clostridia bacterium]